jgi:polyphenol oxidase
MHTWTWKTWNDRPYLTCSLLDPWAHGFLTHHFWPEAPEALTPLLQGQLLQAQSPLDSSESPRPNPETPRIKQIHGNQVLLVSEVPTAQRAPESDWAGADGLMSDGEQQPLWVCSADCTPVLIGDVRTGQVAALHAGWRGTSLKIVAVAVARMQEMGSQVADLRVALGPAIAGSVYQVTEATAMETVQSVLPLNREDRAGSLAQIQALPDAPVLEDPQIGRVKLDVRRVNALQLEQLGLTPEQVAIAPHCTFQEPENFFSYRRMKEKKVQWSGIMSH